MKKVVSIAIFFFVLSTTTFAQPQQEEIDYYQSIFGMNKKAVVAEFLQLDNTDAFWTLYDEYEKTRKILAQGRLKTLMDYAEHYENLTNEKTDALVKESIASRKDFNDLVVKYYKKVLKTSGSKTAAQFYQIENYFVTAINGQLYLNVPLIGELD
jgi:hypothetical protein